MNFRLCEDVIYNYIIVYFSVNLSVTIQVQFNQQVSWCMNAVSRVVLILHFHKAQVGLKALKARQSSHNQGWQIRSQVPYFEFGVLNMS